MDMQVVDPKGLIRDSYLIADVSDAECRSIFLDWALNLSTSVEVQDALDTLITTYGSANKDHPMTDILNAGLTAKSHVGRRGGRKARLDS